MYSYPGGLKERTATQVHDKDPSEVLRRAVVGMLPKNTLRKVAAWQHPHQHARQLCAAPLVSDATAVGHMNRNWIVHCPQARDRKLRIFPDADHPFKDHPRLVPWDPPPRALRRKRPLWELPEGYVPFNPEVCMPACRWPYGGGFHRHVEGRWTCACS
jgi:large subunit ribosomal protein L13